MHCGQGCLDILKTAHEGTSKVKSARLQLLTTKFENLKMMEDESIQDYHLNILDIANTFDSLGEKISDEKLLRKILRYLPKRFDMKVTAIEEAQDISSLKVHELIGSLQNFELNVNNKTDKKGKGITFVSNVDTKEAQGNREDDESLLENIVLLGKQFRRILKQVNRRPRSNVQNIRSNIDNQPGNAKNPRTNEKITQSKGVQCHELKDMVTSEQNVPHFSKDKRKAWMFLGLMMMTLKGKLKVNLLNMLLF